MNLHLTNQVAFIAGSSRGIGRAIAATLLAEGASIVLTGRSETSLEATLADLSTAENRTRILPVTADLADPTQISSALNRTLSHFGRLNHLIANLGAGSGKPGWDQPAEEWQRLFDLNFFASTRLAQAAIPHLRTPTENPATANSILFLSSIVAVEATPAPLPYSAAKAALTNYAKNLARLLAPEGVRVNTIAPGNIFFPGGSWERHLSTRKQAVEHMLQTEVPQNRFGTPQEIASLAAFLCSPAAAFSTGSTYIMDGGQTRTI